MDKIRKLNSSFIYITIILILVVLHFLLLLNSLEGEARTCVMNSGISFGIGVNLPRQLLILLNMIILTIVGYLTVSNFNKISKFVIYLYLTLLIVGILNFIERLRLGAVCDYFFFKIFESSLHFNIPDVIIVIVSTLLILNIFYKNFRHGK